MERDEYKHENQANTGSIGKALGFDFVGHMFKEGWDMDRIKTEMKNWQDERKRE